MRVRLSKFVVALLAGSALFFGAGAGHALLSQAIMPHHMSSSSCQTACASQAQPVLIRLVSEINEHDSDPRPAEPYYLAFIGAGWALVITIATTHLLKYLRWRPPDICKLNVAYRF